jgi:hypothetical protein
MGKLNRKQWYLLAVVMGAAAFLAAFGIALAATVQVSRQVPSTLTVIGVEVLADENLELFHDPEGTQPVTTLEFRRPLLQPPLTPRNINPIIYVKNNSNADLTLIAPCREIRDTNTGVSLGFMNLYIHGRGDACQGDRTIAPGEMVGATVNLNPPEPGLAPGVYSFTSLFGAIGESPDGE